MRHLHRRHTTLPLFCSRRLPHHSMQHYTTLTLYRFASFSFLSTIALLEEENEEQCNANVDTSPPSSFSFDVDADAYISSLCLLFLLIVDVRIDIDKVDHCIVLTDYHHNSHPRCHRPSVSLKLSFYLSFSCHHTYAITCCIFHQ